MNQHPLSVDCARSKSNDLRRGRQAMSSTLDVPARWLRVRDLPLDIPVDGRAGPSFLRHLGHGCRAGARASYARRRRDPGTCRRGGFAATTTSMAARGHHFCDGSSRLSFSSEADARASYARLHCMACAGAWFLRLIRSADVLASYARHVVRGNRPTRRPGMRGRRYGIVYARVEASFPRPWLRDIP